MKSFLITIDTEGDNLWEWKYGDKITTENTNYLPRFQSLCENYGFKPTWLTNYEMGKDSRFVNFIKPLLLKNKCEVGLHLHAVNTPPLTSLEIHNPHNFPFITEYPEDIAREKVHILKNLLENTFEIEITSHRSGRWALNQKYIEALMAENIQIDCSVTPHVDWSTTHGMSIDSYGSDYCHYPEAPFYWGATSKLLEVPMTIRKVRYFESPNSPKDILRQIKKMTFGRVIWIRPTKYNINEVTMLINMLCKTNCDYIMFMLHSSELMPNGSPNFRTNEDIELLYKSIDKIFKTAADFCQGKTLNEFAVNYINNNENTPNFCNYSDL